MTDGITVCVLGPCFASQDPSKFIMTCDVVDYLPVFTKNIVQLIPRNRHISFLYCKFLFYINES